jgi:enoyl reductase-like protein
VTLPKSYWRHRNRSERCADLGLESVSETDSTLPTKHDPSIMVAAPELPLALSISFAPESSTISMTMYDQPEQDKPALPLEFKYKYDPSTPYAPIHEIVEDRNTRIKQVRVAPANPRPFRSAQALDGSCD